MNSNIQNLTHSAERKMVEKLIESALSKINKDREESFLKMVDLADQILIIWDGISHGTKHTVSYAKKKNKNIVLLII